MALTIISRSRLLTGNLTETLRFLYAASPSHFIYEFQKRGVDITDPEKQIPAIAQYAPDFASGAYADKNGNPIVFNIQDVINAIMVDEGYFMTQSEIKFVA